MKKTPLPLIVAGLLLALPGAALGAPLADIDLSSAAVTFTPNETFYRLALVVQGPDGVRFFERVFDGDAPIALELGMLAAKGVAPDGVYTYELVAHPAPRARGVDKAPVATRAQSGSFSLRGGLVVNAEAEPEPAAGVPEKVVFHTGDGSIQGSLCVGIDCAASESFGFDTIRLKENNLRIHFDDTSSTGSFPANDWRFVANDSANGGANYLAIEDSTAGRQIFRVDAGAPANSLRVDAQGDVGVGSAAPAVEVHVVDGDSPTLRLEQDGSSGFTPQTWDVAGNEANFFVRDVTNGSLLSFRIRPGAPTSSLDINADGDVGVGVSTANAKLHVQNTGATEILVQQNGTASDDATIRLLNNSSAGANGNAWVFNHRGNNASFLFNYTGTAGNEFSLDTAGNLTIAGSLTVGPGGCTGCDLVFSPGYEIESIEDHASYMWENRHLPGVGPTPEDQPMNISTKTGGILNELEKAHIYIERLNAELKERDTALAVLAERLARLEQRVEPTTAVD